MLRISSLNELATKWENIEQDLYQVSGELIEHLIKLYYWCNTPTFNHWVNEVYAFCHKIPKLKSTHKYPKSEDIFDMLWTYGDTISDNIIALNKDYKQYPKMEYDNDCDAFCKQYIKWLSDNLSSKGQLSKSEITNKVLELLHKHHRMQGA